LRYWDFIHLIIGLDAMYEAMKKSQKSQKPED